MSWTRALAIAAVTVAAAGIAIWWMRAPNREAARQTARGPESRAASLILVTIDTLRADHVGVYGHTGASTPVLDGVARAGVRFAQAYASAPITLPSHATILTGMYPPSHGARHNGMRLRDDVPTLATLLGSKGFATAAFVSAFPLDRRFGLSRGFSVYDDVLPRGPDGRSLNERHGASTVDAAIAWLQQHRDAPFFAWVHLFEPHAPYGDGSEASRPLSAIQRYDGDVATADREVGRLLDSLGPARTSTLIVIAADHGEAFGEHGEVTHSLFVYDTTLRVPWIMSGPGVPSDGRAIGAPVSLVDLAPTTLRILGQPALDADGIDVSRLFGETRDPEVRLKPDTTKGVSAPANRAIYAESMAPLLDFGWSPLRTVRENEWKYIEAPRPELYDTVHDRLEERSVIDQRPAEAARFAERVGRFGPSITETAAKPSTDRETAGRLASLGYFANGGGGRAPSTRPDPKDRSRVAARLGEIASGELSADDTVAALEAVLREDADNTQAHLRLGVALADRDKCEDAEPHLRRMIAAKIPSADPYLSLALCLRRGGRAAAARAMLTDAQRTQPDDPVVNANLGLLSFDEGHVDEAIRQLQSALSVDPNLHQARFVLARALARRGDRALALSQAETLLARLPATAPQRPEVERLVAALR